MTDVDVVVIGCGALGLSTARQLALQGARVLAVDRALPGSQTSARAAGHSLVVHADNNVGRMMKRSLQAFVDLAAESEAFAVHRVGSVKLACADWAARQLRREVARAETGVQLIDAERVQRLAPYVDTGPAQLAWYTPDDLYFHPPAFLAALLAATRAAGVTIRDRVAVDGVEVEGGRAVAVATSQGRVRAGSVVVAAGPWSADLLSALGIDLPVTVVRHQFTVRGPDPSIDPGMPIVRVLDDATYARPDGSRLIIGRYEPRPHVIPPDALPADTAELHGDTVLIDDAPVSASLFAAPLRWPLAEVRAGMVTMTPDGGYIVDDGGVDGLHFIAGDNVRGLTVSPALGYDVATWVRTGQRPASLVPFTLDRFGPEAAPTPALDHYATIYLDRESIADPSRSA